MKIAMPFKLSKQHRRFAKYNNTGIPWIGEVPDKWEIKKLKYFSVIQFSSVDKHLFEHERPVRVCNYTNVYYGEIIIDDEEFAHGTCSQEEYEKFRIKKNDVIITKDSETADDIAIPAFIGNNFENSVCGYHLSLIRPKQILVAGKYLFRFFQDQGTKKYFELNANGVTRFGLGKSKIKDLIVPIPTINDQDAIVDYLDKKTSLLDRIITAKKKQIELLKEKRSNLINEAVTKGIDKNVEMKDSGVEWIGQIPKEWEVRKLKYCSNKSFKYGANEVAIEEDASQPRFVRITDVDEKGALRPDTFKSLDYDIAKNYFLESGDILFARSGATVGKTFQYKESWGKCCFAGYLIRFSPLSKILSSDFVNYVVSSGYYNAWKSSIFIQATIQNISAEKYKNFTIAVPSVNEQRKIVAYLDSETQRIDTTIALVERSITLLEEYKTSLINHVVTGKINVSRF